MKQVMNERQRLSIPEARALGESALRGAGLHSDEARIITDHVVDAAMCGYEYSGLPKLLNLVGSPRFRGPRRPVSTLRDNGPSVLLDGGNHNGMYALHVAALEAIRRSDAHGMATVAVSDTWMSGRSAYYVEMLARAGLIGIHTVASSPVVAPPGGTRPALGTNPIAFGFPTTAEPLLIDIGTSAFMGTDLKFRERLGIPLPPGVAIDAQGLPTTDAGAARQGSLLPFGGYKGFALSLAMHALGLLCAVDGSNRPQTGHLFIVLRPDRFLPLDQYRQFLTEEIGRIKRTPRQSDTDAIRLPGERSFRQREQALANGIEVDGRVVAALHEWAAGRHGSGESPAPG